MAVGLAALASFALAVGAVMARRGGLIVKPSLGARFTILVGIPIFAGIAAAAGELWEITSLPLSVYLWFGAAGVLHFILGRSLQYSAFRHVGAARATVVITIAPLISVAIAAPVFHEEITLLLLAGAALVIVGPILIAREEARLQRGGGLLGGVQSLTREQLQRGLLLSLLAAVAWGLSPILIKAGLNQEDMPLLGLFLSYVAAGAVVAGYLMTAAERRELATVDPAGVGWFLGGGVIVSIAQALRYLAFSEGDVAVVALMLQLVPVFVFGLTVTFNRNVEALSHYVLIGGVFVVSGSILIALSG